MTSLTAHDLVLQRVRDTWTERAEEWDAKSESNRYAPDRPADLDRCQSVLRLQPCSRLLDAGCGTGQFALAFAARGCRVTGIDLSPGMIARAARHSAERGIEVDWRVGDLTRLSDPAASYDAILARVSLQFVPDPAAATAEFRRVLRPEGRLFVSVPGALSPIYRNAWLRFVRPEETIVNGILPWELEAILLDQGWTILDGWGEFGPDLSGNENALSLDQVKEYDHRLQQAAATIWTFIAGPGGTKALTS